MSIVWIIYDTILVKCQIWPPLTYWHHLHTVVEEVCESRRLAEIQIHNLTTAHHSINHSDVGPPKSQKRHHVYHCETQESHSNSLSPPILQCLFLQYVIDMERSILRRFQFHIKVIIVYLGRVTFPFSGDEN